MRATEIRHKFFDYYTALGYHLLPSASLLDESIPMSFVMSAGLVQIESLLTKEDFHYGNKFTFPQRCFRHFDLNKVGSDEHHLSFFEMLGAFEFGEMDRSVIIQRMWHLATSVFGINQTRLWATYFHGDFFYGNDLSEDIVTKEEWIKVGLQKDHIIGLGIKDNYWLQGTGLNGIDVIRKCGPSTELFFDRGAKRACLSSCQPGCGCGRFIEFSNSLFIHSQFISENKKFEELDSPFCETVIGVERAAMILQGVDSVFEIASYKAILDAIRNCAGENSYDVSTIRKSGYVIADHLRALYQLISDGAPPPGKNGRQRIIKLLIRGVINQLIILNIKPDNFSNTILAWLDVLPNVQNKDEKIVQRLLEYFSKQYQPYLNTISRGELQLKKQLVRNNGKTLSGKQILFLEKQYGYSFLLIENKLREMGYEFLEQDYLNELEKWKNGTIL